ncbi:hypothetical protein BD626DRAFT_510460 [Schizophyllum amplum]|uniref:Anaphase-promoting complex subunit 11 RING-H2 finger domain-containing protein n=1 Tax=Schizophyllum amplum TaxID=97359 RepID=A0A550C219_9AGAR|nr:hypothetical protein BD626DRAFT_510460 [Auriculariopsis ampla]
MHDLVEWIKNMHGSCPTCRRTYLDIRPRTDSDDESSDGGEYVPERDAEEEDSYVLDDDDFSEPDWADTNNEWADNSGDWAAGDDSIEWEDHPVTDHLSALENNLAIVNYSTIEDYPTAEDETTMDDDVDPAFAVDLEGDAEMTDGEGDWGLTDGSSDIMTSDDADMGSARDDAEMDGEDGEWCSRAGCLFARVALAKADSFRRRQHHV